MGEAKDAWVATVAQASPWAIDLALVLVSLVLAVTALAALWLFVKAKARELFGPGATPKQVEQLLEPLEAKINGSLERVEQKFDVHRRVTDTRHHESLERTGEILGRLKALETLEFMATAYQPGRRRGPRDGGS